MEPRQYEVLSLSLICDYEPIEKPIEEPIIKGHRLQLQEDGRPLQPPQNAADQLARWRRHKRSSGHSLLLNIEWVVISAVGITPPRTR